jgi:hypothetical protein
VALVGSKTGTYDGGPEGPSKTRGAIVEKTSSYNVTGY